jgi:hypothetical protein
LTRIPRIFDDFPVVFLSRVFVFRGLNAFFLPCVPFEPVGGGDRGARKAGFFANREPRNTRTKKRMEIQIIERDLVIGQLSYCLAIKLSSNRFIQGLHLFHALAPIKVAAFALRANLLPSRGSVTWLHAKTWHKNHRPG